ncbi:MAG: hypothetical protein ABIL15_05270 [candidate division WOR-3 bacterium]
MLKKSIITITALGMSVFLSAQIPHWEFFNGPWCAQRIVDMGMSYVSVTAPYPPPVIYAVNENTCLAKTTNDGYTWEILPKGHNFAEAIKCVAAHPTNPNIVYKGITGNTSQTGIMKSTDGGYNWVCVNNGLPDAIHPSKLGIFPHPGYYDYLLLGMSSDQQIYAGYSLYRTTDGGNTWEHYSFPWEPHFLNITDFSFDPTAPEVVCFSADYSSDPNNAYRGVWLSEDFGETWVQIGKPGTGPYSMPNPDVTCLAIGDRNIIYAGYYDEKKKISGIQQTTDSGRNWRKMPIILKGILIDILNEQNKIYLVIKSSKNIKFIEYNISNFSKINERVVIEK